jgi:Tfp pilus assembly protein FimV
VLAERAVASSVESDTPSTLRGQVLTAGGTYVAQRGDTLWTIARAMQPSGDLTELLRRLIRLNGGASLAVGQRVLLPS